MTPARRRPGTCKYDDGQVARLYPAGWLCTRHAPPPPPTPPPGTTATALAARHRVQIAADTLAAAAAARDLRERQRAARGW